MRPAALLLPLLLAAAPVLADEAKPPTVTTTGTASTSVVPDEAELRFNLKTDDADLGKAKSLNDDAAAEVLKFLRDANVPDKDMQTTNVRSQPRVANRMNSDERPGTVVGYIVSRQYSVKLHDMNNLAKVYDKLLVDKRVELFSENMSTSKIRELADQARLDAVRVAQDKAELLARASHATVGPAREITEVADDMADAPSIGGRGSFSGGGGSEEATPLGLVQVRASVTVVFDLVPDEKQK